MATEDDIKAVNEAIAEQVRLQKEAEEAFKDQNKALKELLQAEKMYEIAGLDNSSIVNKVEETLNSNIILAKNKNKLSN